MDDNRYRPFYRPSISQMQHVMGDCRNKIVEEGNSEEQIFLKTMMRKDKNSKRRWRSFRPEIRGGEQTRALRSGFHSQLHIKIGGGRVCRLPFIPSLASGAILDVNIHAVIVICMIVHYIVVIIDIVAKDPLVQRRRCSDGGHSQVVFASTSFDEGVRWRQEGFGDFAAQFQILGRFLVGADAAAAQRPIHRVVRERVHAAAVTAATADADAHIDPRENIRVRGRIAPRAERVGSDGRGTKRESRALYSFLHHMFCFVDIHVFFL